MKVTASMKQKAYRVKLAAEELANFAEGLDRDCREGEDLDLRAARTRLMSLIHALNYAYILFADDVDTAQVRVVD